MQKLFQNNQIKIIEKAFNISFMVFIFIVATGPLNLKQIGIPLSFGGNLQKLILWPILFSILPFMNKIKSFSKYSLFILVTVVIFIIFTFLGDFFHTPSTEGEKYHMHFITGIMTLYLSQFFSEKEKINKILMLLITGGTICVLIGFLNTLFFESKNNFMLLESTTKRIITSVGHPNFLGSFLILILPLSLNSMHFTIIKNKLIFFITTNIILILGIIFSYSRTSWVSALLGIFFFTILKFKNHFQKILFTSFIFVIITFTTFYYLPKTASNPIFKRLLSFKNLKHDANVIERIYAFHSSLKIIKANMFFGIGAGNYRFQNEFIKYHHPSSKLIMPHPHNMFLHIGTSFGMVILTIFFIIIIFALFRNFYALRNYCEYIPISSSLLCSLLSILIFGLFDSPIFSPRINTLIMLIIGFSFSLKLENKEIIDINLNN